jgi:hypothetical protein
MVTEPFWHILKVDDRLYLVYTFQTMFLGSLVQSMNITQHLIVLALFKKVSVSPNRIPRVLLLDLFLPVVVFFCNC